MPIMCGNTAILKASENSPYTQQLIVECFLEAGLPAGVLQFLCCSRESASALTETMIAHPSVQRINFTGSTVVGRIIANLCAKYLKISILELGGKAPVIVHEDADLVEATNAVIFGALQHAGQICMSTERVIVHESVMEEFKALLKTKVNSLRASINDDDAIGALISAKAAERVHMLVQDALDNGATVVAGSAKYSGAVHQPIILACNDMASKECLRIYSEESFGPTAMLYTYSTIQQAVDIANDTEYGLVAAVFTKNISIGLDIAKKVRSGSVHINGASIFDQAHLPLGGMKASGWGRFGGNSVVREFTEERVVTISTQSGNYPF